VRNLRIYLGWDPKDAVAYDVAVSSIRRFWPEADIQPIRLDLLRACGLYTREMKTKWVGQRSVMWDTISDAPCSTEFAISRFAVPLLQHEGYALFVDADVVFNCDPRELLQFADPDFAVSVVQHKNYVPVELHKMDGQVQTAYDRKNWSSVILYNCDHPANRAFTLKMLNTLPGRDLHRFCWLRDSEIGSLPAAYNWLVGVQPQPTEYKIAHFTLGGPWFKKWPGAEHDEIWQKAKENV
jgi:hypothetical protein